MQLSQSSQDTVYLLQTTHEHILDDGRSKSSQEQEGWLDSKQAEVQLVQLLKQDIERKTLDSSKKENWNGLTMDLKVVDGTLMATIEDRHEFEIERISYQIIPLIIKDNYEI